MTPWGALADASQASGLRLRRQVGRISRPVLDLYTDRVQWKKKRLSGAHAPGPREGHSWTPTDYHDPQRLQIQTLPRRRPRTRGDRTNPRHVSRGEQHTIVSADNRQLQRQLVVGRIAGYHRLVEIAMD